MFSVAAMTAEDDVAEDDLNFFTVQKLHFIGEVDRFITVSYTHLTLPTILRV